MKNFVNTVRFQSGKTISGEHENNVLRELSLLKGIDGLHLGKDFVEVDYFPQLQSPDSLKQALGRASFEFTELPARQERGLFKNMISNLTKENRKTDGRKGRSCCG